MDSTEGGEESGIKEACVDRAAAWYDRLYTEWLPTKGETGEAHLVASERRANVAGVSKELYEAALQCPEAAKELVLDLVHGCHMHAHHLPNAAGPPAAGQSCAKATRESAGTDRPHLYCDDSFPARRLQLGRRE